MATTAVYLNKEIVEQARIYAASKGESLSSIIEDYLNRLTFKYGQQETELDEVPDIVLSLLGAGTSVEEDDLNGRKAYYGHLEKKHK